MKIVILSVLAAMAIAACSPADKIPAVPAGPEVSENQEGNNQNSNDTPNKDNVMTDKINITVNGTTLTATLVDNSSTAALKELLRQSPVTISMSDYGNFEKVGQLPQSLPRNDEQITTQAGDLILYLGRSFVIYYDTNSYSFTRLGRIDNVSQSELKKILGRGDVSVTLSINK